jgi:hypothetical protein
MRAGFALMHGAACASLLFGAATNALAAGNTMSSRYLDEPAIVFNAADLKKARLPSRVHLRNIAPVFGSQLSLACLGVPLQPHDLAVYLTGSGRCMALSDMTVSSLDAEHGPEAARGIAQERDRIERQLQSSDFVVLQPETRIAEVASLCYCPGPGNSPPVASVLSGSPQEATAGAAITDILFKATDADSATLTHSFFHSLDGGPQASGLPAGLAQSCSAGSGTLSCTVSGTAPLTNGIYLIRFEARDGSSADSATAQLTVVGGAPPETLFSNGFEDG